MSAANFPTQLRLKKIQVLLKQDLYRTLQGPHGQLFFIFFSIFWLWVLWLLSSGFAQALAKTSNEIDETFIINFIFSWIFEGDKHMLFAEYPSTLSFYYIVMLSTMPMFALIAASNQTAGDISSKYLRFLIPRASREEIFTARFLGALFIINGGYLFSTLLAAVLSLSIDPNANLFNISTYVIQIVVSTFIYSLPLVSFMTLCSAALGSASISALTGTSCYTIIALIIALVELQSPDLSFIAYLLPSSTYSLHLSLGVMELVTALLASLLYVIVFCSAGWLIFSKRDI